MPAPIPANVAMHVRFGDPGVLDQPRLSVDWGDGTASSDTLHAYTVPGAYEVVIMVADKDGGTAQHRVIDPIWVYDANVSDGTPPGYEVIDLGTLGGERAVPAGLNNRGEVVGSSMTAESEYQWETHAFLWKGGVMTDLGTSLVGWSRAQTINDDGFIGGALTDDNQYNSLVVWQNGAPSTFRTGWDDNQASVVAVDVNGRVLVNIAGHENGTAALYRNGELIPLGGFGAGGFATASDINSHGQIVGYSALKSTGPQRLAWHAFLYHDGVMTDLGDLYPCPDPVPSGDDVDCGHTAALSINETGNVVGAARPPGGVLRAVIWENGSRTPKDLGFGAGASRAVAINSRGEIAGDTDVPGEGYFRTADGTVVTLGSLGGGGTQVVAMNEAGVIIGSSRTATGDLRPFIWRRETGMVGLGVGPYKGSAVAAYPVAINDRGDVTGSVFPCPRTPWGGCQGGGAWRALLWRTKTPAVVTR